MNFLFLPLERFMNNHNVYLTKNKSTTFSCIAFFLISSHMTLIENRLTSPEASRRNTGSENETMSTEDFRKSMPGTDMCPLYVQLFFVCRSQL